MSIQISSSQINTPMHSTRKPAAEPHVQEKHGHQNPTSPQDKTTLSRSSMAAPESVQAVNLGEEDTNMAKIAGLSKAEGLATAHSPISYERVMQLLEG
ncbi:hypothetical protein [Desulfobotulus mexicanus]|uniref:Uncharacterized protein n=1 Tax=Desulfobotulus mexicanus TaxID=2586642 RepID=A0A5Q4VJH9_9BACT|nr:hypothetical protein [Desulfobotulus mexicanus]TYT76290.1 hypothetical protein FIM25_01700 [Desulfobotulus mexicanus]